MKLATRILFSVIFVVLPSLPVFGQDGEQGVVVTGEGVISIDPDRAILRLGVTREAPRAQEAQQRVNRVLGEILEGVTALGIEERKIQSSTLQLNPVYQGHSQQDGRRISHYQATYLVSIDVDELDRVGPVVDAALSAGANELRGVQYGVRDDSEARQQALRQAVDQASKKAGAMAEAAGVRLGELLGMSESYASSGPVVSTQMRAMAGEAASATQVLPGQIDVSARVQLRYAIAR